MPFDLIEIKRLFEEGTICLVDVREQEEWDQLHIQGAYHLPLSQLHPTSSLATLSQNKPWFLYCRKGGRATTASQILKIRYNQVEPLLYSIEELATLFVMTMK